MQRHSRIDKSRLNGLDTYFRQHQTFILPQNYKLGETKVVVENTERR